MAAEDLTDMLASGIRTQMIGSVLDRADDLRRVTNGQPRLTVQALRRAGEILDAGQRVQTYHFIEPPKAPTLRWRAGVWSAS